MRKLKLSELELGLDTELVAKTNCKCKHPDWVMGLATDEMAARKQYYLQCDSCKEYAYVDDDKYKYVMIELYLHKTLAGYSVCLPRVMNCHSWRKTKKAVMTLQK